MHNKEVPAAAKVSVDPLWGGQSDRRDPSRRLSWSRCCPNQANGFGRGPVVEDHRVMTQSPGSSARWKGLVAETGKDMTAYVDLGDLNPIAVELRYGLDDEQNSPLDRR